MYRQVVVPLDGSELAEEVLPHVAEMIRGQDSHVCLLSVTPTMRGVASSGVDLSPDARERQRVEQELEKYLRQVARRLEPAAAEVEVTVRSGRPADEVLAFADYVGADLIAMTTHGRSGIRDWIFGSVADRILRGATCPVLLVRAGQARLRTTYQRILVPLDGSELAEQILPYVKAFIHPDRIFPLEDELRDGTRVFLVSVLTAGLGDRTVALLTSYPPGLQLSTTALRYAEVEMRRYLRSVAAVLRDHGAVVHIEVRQGAPADEILDYAAQVEADLISMTTHGLSGLSRWVYGNVAGKVLQGAYSPVLLVRPASET
ncbi:MAG: universal stress protein [Chloroflexota bacterium]|nr:universal stress protein [Chloroflexota bacterium]